MRPTQIRDKKMEIIERVKTIFLDPKEEWTIIEAENAPHAKVFTGHLLPLALIPAIAKFVVLWWHWRKAVKAATDKFESAMSSYNNVYGGDEIAKQIEEIKDSMPFNAVWGIIQAVTIFAIIIGSVYITAVVINAFAEKNGSKKNFNRAFSLTAYSFTPLCVAGVLYLYSPLAVLVSIVGLYGAYLLYLGLSPIMKPATDKITGYFVVALIAALGSWLVLTNFVPDITNDIYKNYKIEQAKNLQKQLNDLQNSPNYDREMYKQLERKLRRIN